MYSPKIIPAPTSTTSTSKSSPTIDQQSTTIKKKQRVWKTKSKRSSQRYPPHLYRNLYLNNLINKPAQNSKLQKHCIKIGPSLFYKSSKILRRNSWFYKKMKKRTTLSQDSYRELKKCLILQISRFSSRIESKK